MKLRNILLVLILLQKAAASVIFERDDQIERPNAAPSLQRTRSTFFRRYREPSDVDPPQFVRHPSWKDDEDIEEINGDQDEDDEEIQPEPEQFIRYPNNNDDDDEDDQDDKGDNDNEDDKDDEDDKDRVLTKSPTPGPTTQVPTRRPNEKKPKILPTDPPTLAPTRRATESSTRASTPAPSMILVDLPVNEQTPTTENDSSTVPPTAEPTPPGRHTQSTPAPSITPAPTVVTEIETYGPVSIPKMSTKQPTASVIGTKSPTPSALVMGTKQPAPITGVTATKAPSLPRAVEGAASTIEATKEGDAPGPVDFTITRLRSFDIHVKSIGGIDEDQLQSTLETYLWQGYNTVKNTTVESVTLHLNLFTYNRFHTEAYYRFSGQVVHDQTLGADSILSQQSQIMKTILPLQILMNGIPVLSTNGVTVLDIMVLYGGEGNQNGDENDVGENADLSSFQSDWKASSSSDISVMVIFLGAIVVVFLSILGIVMILRTRLRREKRQGLQNQQQQKQQGRTHGKQELTVEHSDTISALSAAELEANMAAVTVVSWGDASSVKSDTTKRGGSDELLHRTASF